MSARLITITQGMRDLVGITFLPERNGVKVHPYAPAKVFARPCWKAMRPSCIIPADYSAELPWRIACRWFSMYNTPCGSSDTTRKLIHHKMLIAQIKSITKKLMNPWLATSPAINDTKPVITPATRPIQETMRAMRIKR